MFRRILYLVQKELISALRNNMVIYTVLFPLLLAIGLRLLLPSVQSMKLTIAVDTSSEQKVIERLENYSKVELYNNKESLIKRVEKSDDVAGIMKEGSEYAVILEGNENGEAEAIASALMNIILSDKPQAIYEHVSLNKSDSMAKGVSASLLLLTAILIGGFIIGLSIVDEKESKSIRALSVSPTRMHEYMLAHTIICIVCGIVLSVFPSLILVGTEADYSQIVIAAAASTGVGIILGYMIGIFADNLISAIGVIKILVLILLGIPVGSIFVPQTYQWVFYIFPHYWAFQSYQSIFNNNNHWLDFNLTCSMTLILSIVFIILLAPFVKRRLKLR